MALLYHERDTDNVAELNRRLTPRIILKPHHATQCHVGGVSARLMIVLLARSTTSCPIPVARSRLAASSTMWTGRRGLIGAWHRPH